MPLSISGTGAVVTVPQLQFPSPSSVELPSGRWVMAHNSATYDGAHASGVGYIRTSDNGKDGPWTLRATITARTNMAQSPNLLLMPNGDVIVTVFEEFAAYGGINYVYRLTNNGMVLTYQGRFNEGSAAGAYPTYANDGYLVIDVGGSCIDSGKAYFTAYRYIGGSPVYRDMRIEAWSTADNGVTFQKEANVTEFGWGSSFGAANESGIDKLPGGDFVVFFRWDGALAGSSFTHAMHSGVARGATTSAFTITDTTSSLGLVARCDLTRAGSGLLAGYQQDSQDLTQAWGTVAFTEDAETWTTPLHVTEDVAASNAGNVMQGGILMDNGDIWIPRKKSGGHGVDYVTVTGIPQPPPTIDITPPATVLQGTPAQFTATVSNGATPAWSATGGTIDADGWFTADGGAYSVAATVGEVSDVVNGEARYVVRGVVDMAEVVPITSVYGVVDFAELGTITSVYGVVDMAEASAGGTVLVYGVVDFAETNVLTPPLLLTSPMSASTSADPYGAADPTSAPFSATAVPHWP